MIEATGGLVIANVSKRFDRQTVLDDVSLDVPLGASCALLGSNGAGKSTLLNICLGHLEPDDGFVSVASMRIDRHPVTSKAKLAYVPEIARLYPRYSAVQNVQYFERLMGRRRERAEAVNALQRFGISEKDAMRDVGTFSKGMRQRVSLAIGVLKGAEVFLLDEPTSGLDPDSAQQLAAILRSLANAGKAVCFTSHDLRAVDAMADRVVRLEQGRLHAA
ncbi:MAG: ABC transporter ATP-binding protein [Acidobacteria bacterium]|nr:ABC transporter ATP-binding protein [Acidobacteriota bacterium]